jgi:hypothetical protein
MNKRDRIAAFVDTFESTAGASHHPCYAGFFECFNAGDYYEAHDVLEQLWLECRDDNRLFYQGLIQLAGAFVHLKKQRERPGHPTDGRRLRPAARLFLLAEKNLAPYAPTHLDLDVEPVLGLSRDLRERIEQSNFEVNPWSPGEGPFLGLRSWRER